MMKRWISGLLCLLLLLSCATAFAAGARCRYYPNGRHRYRTVSVISQPTCTQTGRELRACACGAVSEVNTPVDPSNHNYTQTGFSYPTCTEPGYTYIQCTRCGNQDTLVEPAYGHSYGSWTVTRQPTCTSRGERVRTCSECGDTDTERISATGHSLGRWTVTRQPACTVPGERRADCSTCGETVYEDISATGHTAGESFVLIEATDHSMGAYGTVCTVCGETYETDRFYPDGTLYRGMDKSDDVKALQQMLIDTGFLNDKADGVFGKKTEAAVSDFQAFAEIEETGIAYPQTISLLTGYINGKDPTVHAYPCCGAVPEENGGTAMNSCEWHLTMIYACSDLLADAGEDPDERQDALEQAFRMWQDECDYLFGVWAAACDADTAALIEAQRGMFNASLAADMEAIRMLNPEAPGEAESYGVQKLREKCTELCSLVYVPAE